MDGDGERKVVAIVQARMGSRRFPGKVLQDLHGETVLGRVVERLLEARSIDEVVVATSTLRGDDPVAREADRLGVAVWRGSESDVLGRLLGAARTRCADAIVRILADGPLIDPGIVDTVVAALTPDVDYASNTQRRTYPHGLEVEALHRDTLERIGRLATSAVARAGVTTLVLDEPGLFRGAQVCDDIDASALRWTIDTPEDLRHVRELCALAGRDRALVPYRELLAIVRARSALDAPVRPPPRAMARAD